MYNEKDGVPVSVQSEAAKDVAGMMLFNVTRPARSKTNDGCVASSHESWILLDHGSGFLVGLE